MTLCQKSGAAGQLSPAPLFTITLLNGDACAGCTVIFTIKSKYVLNAIFVYVIQLRNAVDLLGALRGKTVS